MKTKLLFTFIFTLAIALVVNAQTPIHSWNFNDDSANDAIGDAHGTFVGDSYAEGGQLIIEADASWVEIPADKVGVSTLSAVSVVAKFTTFTDETYNSGFHMLWYFGGSEPAEAGGDVSLGSNGIFLSPARGDDVCRTAISTGNIATPWTQETGVNWTGEIAFGGETYEIVSVFDAQSVSMYINGEFIGSDDMAAMANSLAAVKDDFGWIGRGGYSGDPNYWAMIDEVTMYDVALDAQQVTDIYNGKSKVKNLNDKPDFKVHGFNGKIFIVNPDNVDVKSVSVYNMGGRLVYKSNGAQEVIDANLSSSIYIVKIQGENQVYTSKVSIR